MSTILGMQEYDDWLARLAPGDEAFAKWWRGAFGFTYEPGKVARVTATQVILQDGVRFRKTTGREVGSRGLDRTLVMPTDDLRDKIQAKNNRDRLRHETMRLGDSDRDTLTDAEVAAMLASLDACRAEGGE